MMHGQKTSKPSNWLRYRPTLVMLTPTHQLPHTSDFCRWIFNFSSWIRLQQLSCPWMGNEHGFCWFCKWGHSKSLFRKLCCKPALWQQTFCLH